MSKVVLKYTGGGYGGAINGVPARDITDEDVARLDLNLEELVKGGLYEATDVTPIDPFAEAAKAETPEYDDKAVKRSSRSSKKEEGKG